MSRPFRHVVTILAVLSLLLCLATVLLWVRSYSTCDAWTRGTAGSRIDISSLSGEIRWQDEIFPPAWRTRFPTPTGYRASPSATAPPLSIEPKWYSTWFRGNTRSLFVAPSGILRVQILYIPDSFIVLSALVLPSLWAFVAFLKRTRPTPGFCCRCGYDLRATPNRCPECGTPITSTPA